MPVDFAGATSITSEPSAGNTRRLEVYNPAHPHELVGTISRGAAADVDRAVAQAKAAQGDWAVRSHEERAAILSRALNKLGADIEQRARLYVRENGKTLAEARAELTDLSIRARFTLELAPHLDAPRILPAAAGRTFVHPVPYGVVVSIVPWNAPVSLGAMQILPALLTGNAVVLKPPESCPLALLKTAELLAEALPEGLLTAVTGLPDEIGDPLCKHPDVGQIGFTGGVRSAKKILCNAADAIRPVNAELGGNDAAIIMDDADLEDEILQRMAASVFRMAGQVCMAIKRIYVPAALHDRFVESFSAVVDRFVVGDGLEAGVTMGPLHTSAALTRAHDLLDEAARDGAEILQLGTVSDVATFDQGHFMRPVVVLNARDDMRLVKEEQFCAAIPILRYNDVDDAVRRANESMFGLGGSVWGRDVERAIPLARKIRAGTVFVNTHGTNSVNRQAPYGGVKQSGHGRRAGLEGLAQYYELQTLTTHER